jgi:TDG/mug DNA glycosylase family protein
VDYVAVDEVTPNELARSLGVTGLQFRNWLRSLKAAGHPIVAAHEHRSRYRFTRAEADRLAAEFRAGAILHTRPPGTSPRAARSAHSPLLRAFSAQDPLAGLPLSDDPGHRVTARWMGVEITTLADLLRPELAAVVVGINPSPVSVAAGHYYRGQVGQRFYTRLAQAGVIDRSVAGFEDDAAYAAGIGFTDVVKRATARADGLRPGELAHGRDLLDAKLTDLKVPRVLFTFKAGAQALLGRFDGHGLLTGKAIAGAEVFVMPGPMERTDSVNRALDTLRAWWNA